MPFWQRCQASLLAARELLLIIGLLAGGAWAVFVFVMEDHAELAELNAARLDMQNKSFQDAWQPSLDVQLTVQSVKAATRPGFYIQAHVSLQNKGKLKGAFLLDKRAFRLYQVTFDASGRPQHGRVLLHDRVSTPEEISRALLLPGETLRLPFVHYTEQTGLYYLDVNVQQSPDDATKAWPAHWVKPNMAYWWTSGQLVDVGPDVL